MRDGSGTASYAAIRIGMMARVRACERDLGCARTTSTRA